MTSPVDTFDLTTLARQKVRMGLTATTDDALISGYITSLSRLIEGHLERRVKLKEWELYFDVKYGQRILHLPGWPIARDLVSGNLLINLYNDNTLPPTFSTAMVEGEDYVVYFEEEEYGKIEFADSVYILGGPRAVKAVWTGGMATRTSVEGTDGDPQAAGVFTSASATFETDRVVAGPGTVLRIQSSPSKGNNGDYPILSIDSENQLKINGTFPDDTQSAESWIITTAGFIGLYPDIEEALSQQIIFHWKQKDKPDVASIAVGGQRVMFTKFRDLDFLPEVQRVLQKYRLEEYP